MVEAIKLSSSHVRAVLEGVEEEILLTRQELTALLYDRSKHLTMCIESNRMNGELDIGAEQFIEDQAVRLITYLGFLRHTPSARDSKKDAA